MWLIANDVSPEKVALRTAKEGEELSKGIAAEKEHVGSIKWLIEQLGGSAGSSQALIDEMAERIAKDHLEERPDYYSRLEKMEKGG